MASFQGQGCFGSHDGMGPAHLAPHVSSQIQGSEKVSLGCSLGLAVS